MAHILDRRSASSASLRPSSSASTPRPSSSLSARPRSSSSVSTSRPQSRPQSRVSRRPSSRHDFRTRLQPLARTLVAQLTGLQEEGTPDDPDGQNFQTSLNLVLKNLDATTLNKGATSVDLRIMDQQIHGHALKARVNSQDELSEALQMSYHRVKSSVVENEELDQGIKMYRLPDHLQFLVSLSQPPSSATLAYAENLVYLLKNPPPPPKPLTWADILAEEPFEGEHWEGVYGLPPGSVRGISQESTDDWDSTPSLSPLESDLEFDGDEPDLLQGTGDSTELLNEEKEDSKPDENDSKMVPPFTLAHRLSLEKMKAKQYWRDDWKSDVDVTKEFDLKDTSTLGLAIQYTVGRTDRTSIAHRIPSEYDVVREVLMALQGRQNLLYVWKDSGYMTRTKTPRLAHLSAHSQNSILASLAELASTVQILRIFCARVLSSHPQWQVAQDEVYRNNLNISRTIEAFADAVDAELRIFDHWCAAREEDMCRALGGVYYGSEPSPGLVVSLLNTEKAMRDRFFPAFDALLEVVRDVVPELVNSSHLADERRASLRTRVRPSSVVTAALMDTLFARAQGHIERGEDADVCTGGVLMRVFVQAAEPVWSMMGNWLRDGMSFGFGLDDGRLDDEFFIESTGLGFGMIGPGLLDPDFWKEGYSLREDVESVTGGNAGKDKKVKAIPMFLEHVAEPVLSAGRAVGLLRALGTSLSVENQDRWMTFHSLVSSGEQFPGPSRSDHVVHRRAEKLFAVSVDTLSRLIYDGLAPRCDAAGALLAKILVEECGLWDHLRAMEDLYFMRRGDAMSHFTDLVFAKMDTQQPWGDFHFLNTAFADVVTASISTGKQTQWIRPSLVRFSYRNRDRSHSIDTTVRALDGLSVDYAVPFPLAYVFQPRVIQVYCEIFLFLVQVKRAKSVLERILVRGEAARHELKPFYAIRGRLSWFINTLLNFLTTNAMLRFHEKFQNAKSLDDMIQLHEEHIETIYSRCFLATQTRNLHRAIISIMDMSLHFSGFFVAFAGDTATHDVSKQSISMRRHRSRRLRRQRRNIIGFTQSLHERADSTSSSEDEDEEFVPTNVPSTSFSMSSTSVSMADGSSILLLDKLPKELDELVRFVKRGVESLANGAGEASPAFGIFAFALEDWDL
ncbi:Spc97 / Spc98 family domain containing protein [Amanita muscaria]